MNILILSQEDAALRAIGAITGLVPPEQRYVDVTAVFDTANPTKNQVVVTLKGKSSTSIGQPGMWSGTKTYTIKRSRLRQPLVPISLRVPYREGMAIEHILKGLFTYHGFSVSAKELEFKPVGSNTFAQLPESYRVPAGVLTCRFHQNNIRYDHIESEFSIVVYRDVRPDVGIMLPRQDVGNVIIASEG